MAAANRFDGRGGLRDAVVLHHEKHRELPNGGQIQALIQQSLAERAIADDRGDDRSAVAALHGQAMADADGGHAALHAVAVEIAKGEVLAAADAAADAGLSSHNLCEQPDESPGVSQEMAVVAMIRKHDVAGIG